MSILQTLMSVQLLPIPVTEMLCVQTLKAVSVVSVMQVTLVMVYHVVSRHSYHQC